MKSFFKKMNPIKEYIAELQYHLSFIFVTLIKVYILT